MSEIAKALLEHDSAFAEVADVLFGGGADELIRKLSPDQSELSASRKKFERRQAQVGLASNIVGLAAGGASLYDTARNPVLRGKTGTTFKPKDIRITRKTKALAAGALGLQAANLGGDVVANRVLARSAKKNEKKKVKKSEISKVKFREAYGEAKRAGYNAGRASDDMRSAARDARIVARRAKRATGVVGVAALAGAGGAGYYAGSKKSGKKFSLKPMIAKKPSPNVKEIPYTKGGVAAKAAAVSADKTKKELGKSEQFDIEWGGELSKMDTDKRQVFGWASITKLNGEDVIDKQGDYIALDEIEKSAYHYVHNSRKGGDMHQRDGEVPLHKSDMIESFVVTPEKLQKMGLDPNSLPHGWWVGYQVNDEDLWQSVKEGKRVGFSIHGKGVRTPLEV
jgi:hypothetical protein